MIKDLPLIELHPRQLTQSLRRIRHQLGELAILNLKLRSNRGHSIPWVELSKIYGVTAAHSINDFGHRNKAASSDCHYLIRRFCIQQPQINVSYLALTQADGGNNEVGHASSSEVEAAVCPVILNQPDLPPGEHGRAAP